MARRRPLSADQVITALAHPIRANVVFALADSDQPRSPVELARQLGGTIGNIGHHVRVLRDLGAVRLVHTRQRRGAIEHFYRLTDDTALRATIDALRPYRT
jgi:DNA-binding transcriptional ArsR family regulator